MAANMKEKTIRMETTLAKKLKQEAKKTGEHEADIVRRVLRKHFKLKQ